MNLRDLLGLDHFWEDFFGGYKNRKQREKAEQELRGLFAQAAFRTYRQSKLHQDHLKQREEQARWREDGKQGKVLQYQDADFKVEVVNGFSRDHDCFTTDIKVFHRDPRITVHLHIIFDESGNMIYEQWNKDR